jgi:zinc protease
MFIKRNFAAWLWGAFAFALSQFAQAGLPIQHWQTANGAQVYFVESRGIPLLDVAVHFDAGARRDTADKSGVSGLTARLMTMGADDLSEEDIARQLADVGAQLVSNSDSDTAGVVLRTLSSATERQKSLHLMARILQTPTFPESAVEREKDRVIADLQEEATQPGPIGEKAFYAGIYGSHPYATPGKGSVATVSSLTRQDAVEFHRRHYVSDDAVIAMVGDISRDEASAIAEQLSAGLGRRVEKLPAMPEVQVPSEAKTINLPHPATQSHILLGLPGVSRGDPDYFSLYVGNYILGGGGFASRLTNEVREKRGLAYSVYSYFLPLAQPGPFQVGLQTKRDQSAEALKVVRATLERFMAEGPTQDELRRAKQNINGGFPLRIDSNKKILGYLSVIGFYHLPLDYLDQFMGNVDKVSLESVKRAFQRRIEPDRMVTVVVGSEP